MSILGDQAAADLETVLDDWGDAVKFTATTGTPPATITVPAVVNRTSMGKDLVTGETVPARRASLTCRLAELTTMPADGWKVEGTDLSGAFTSYVKGDPLPDRALGIVTIFLME